MSRAVLFAMVAIALAAPRAAADQLTPRRVLLVYEVDDRVGLQPLVALALYESLLSSLGDASTAKIVEYGRSAPIPPRDRFADRAREVGCDAWMAVGVLIDRGILVARIEIFDLLRGRRVHGGGIEMLIPELQDLNESTWADVARALESTLPPAAGTITVAVVAPPGSVIRGLREVPVEMPGEGEAEVTLAVPTTLGLEVEASGRYTLRRQVYVGVETKRIDLDPAPLPAYAAEAGLEAGQFPILGFSWLLEENRAFVRLGLTGFFLGLSFPEADKGSRDRDEAAAGIVHLPLAHLWAQTGIYLSDFDADLRYYAGFGVVLRLFFGEDYFGAEPVVPFGVQPFVGVEFAADRSFAFYFQWAPLVFPLPHPDYFRATIAGAGDRFIHLPGDSTVIDPAVFALGLRWFP